MKQAVGVVGARHEASPGRFPDVLPRYRLGLHGREEVLHEIALAAPRFRWLALVGTAGVGKSRLAIEACRRGLLVTDDFLFVALSKLSDSRSMLDEIAQTAGLRDAYRSSAEVLGEVLTQHAVTLVLDNIEHLVGADDIVEQLLEAYPAVRVISTSRIDTARSSQRTIRVEPLATTIDAASKGSPALNVLCAAASAAGVDLDDDARTLAELNEICDRLGGIPLALELAGARMRLLSPTDINAALRSSTAVIGTGSPHVDGRHQSLSTAIDWSIRLLGDNACDLLMGLATFVGGFTAVTAEEYMGWPTDTLLNALDEVLDSHLIRRIDTSSPPRFQLFPAVRERSFDLLDGGEADERLLRHARWCSDLAALCAPHIDGPDGEEPLRRLDADISNINAAVEWLTERHLDDDLALGITSTLWRYWWMRGRADEGLRQVTALLESTRCDPAAVAKGHLAAADLAEITGDLQRSLAEAETAERLFGELADQDGLARTWNSKALVEREFGRFDEAIALHERALAAFRRSRNQRGVAAAESGIASVAYRRGDVAQAVSRWSNAADVLRDLGDRHSLAMALSNIAAGATALGDFERSAAASLEAIHIARSLDDSISETIAEANLGHAYIDLGRLDEAEAALIRATSRNPDRSGWISGHLHDSHALLELGRGRLRAAARRLVDAFEIGWRAERSEILAHAVEHAGLVACAAGEHEAAIELFAAASARRSAESTSASAHETVRLSDAEAAAGARLDRRTVTEAERRGAALTTDQTLAALRRLSDIAPDLQQPSVSAILRDAGLSKREAEVAEQLIARRTDQEIADALFISRRTVASHVASVLDKLRVSSRRGVEGVVQRLAAPGSTE